MNSILALVAVVLGMFQQGVKPNFSGVWELNKAATPASPNPPDRMRFRIEHQGEVFSVTIRVTNHGLFEQQTEKYVIGQESKNLMHGAPMTSQCAWEGNVLVAHSLALFGKTELRLTDRWILSPDGRTLTSIERHKFGSEPEAEDTRVFDRQAEGTWEPDQLAEEVYKNIQVLKGVPAPRLQGVMLNLSTWLGVQCVHCHVVNAAQVFEYEKDDKPAKQTARKMFAMVRKIGQDNFPDGNPVTCWTCHRGRAKPESLPTAQ